jgi:hypothetical protein
MHDRRERSEVTKACMIRVHIHVHERVLVFYVHTAKRSTHASVHDGGARSNVGTHDRIARIVVT